MEETKVKEKKNNKKEEKLRVKMKDLYENVNHFEMSILTNIYDKKTLKSNFKIFLDEHMVSFIITSLVILVLLILTLCSDLKALFIIFGVLLLAFAYAIYINTFTLKMTEKNLISNYQFRKDIIPYEKVVNIYLSKQHISGFIYTYNIVVLYLTEYKGLDGKKKERIDSIILPTYALRKKDILDFFDNLEFSHEYDEEYDKEEQKKARKLLKEKSQQKTSTSLSDKAFLIGFFVVLGVVIIGVSALVIALVTRS